MPCTLRYGADSSVRLDLANGVLVAECGVPRVSPLEDLAAAVTDALAKPLDYPSLARSTTPGDRVVIPLSQGMLRGGEIAAAVVGSLVDAGVQPDGIAVLRTLVDARSGRGDPRPWLADDLIGPIRLLTHDPGDRDDLAYLAATETGEPILLNRAITDADVVVPVGCYESRWAAGNYGVHGTVFPTFSDERTIKRFRSPSALDARGRPKRKPIRVVEEVGWLLGVTFAVEVIPGPGDGVLHVAAGATDAVRRRARVLYEAAWRWSVPHRASLVVAGIEGSSSEQTWDNVARALAVAEAVVEDGGAIALCCEVAEEPGPGVRCLADASARPDAMRWIRKQCPEDALWATLLAQTLDRARVYLLSRLDESLVEELEIAAVAKAEEVARLAGRHQSVVVVGNAARAMVAVEGS